MDQFRFIFCRLIVSDDKFSHFFSGDLRSMLQLDFSSFLKKSVKRGGDFREETTENRSAGFSS